MKNDIAEKTNIQFTTPLLDIRGLNPRTFVLSVGAKDKDILTILEDNSKYLQKVVFDSGGFIDIRPSIDVTNDPNYGAFNY